MIAERSVWKKLEELAAVFNNHIRAKRYHQAKYCYDTARNVSVFLEMDEKEYQKLFGYGNKEDRNEEMFKRELVQKVYVETCVKGQKEPESCVLCQQLFEQKKRA